ncbi:MAG: hypothetical protein F4Z74_00085 [Acidobacteria bacterium]|nr:hypothetical protein [Acidobacteriota bacterium]MYE42410.1 hypothetical protein [Acidobacteriota bacterium]
MKLLRWPVALVAALVFLGGVAMGTHQPAADDAVSKHMVAEATLAAHFVDAALRAGMDRDAINGALRRIANETVISEFWISDENGEIAFSNIEGVNFAFPTDPSADSQAAPFAALLTGDETVVVQGAAPRVLDGAVFQYVGVAGVDQPRIVQVGLSAAELAEP